MKISSYIIVALIALFSAASCKKKEQAKPEEYSIVLDTPSVSGNDVTLKWTVVGGKSIQSIQLEKSTDTTYTGYNNTIAISNDATSFTDTLTMSRYVRYKLKMQVFDGTTTKTVYSNPQVFVRSDLDFIPFAPVSAAFDDATHYVYLGGQKGELAIYDASSHKILKSIETGSWVNRCTIATHNGKKELYIPRNDGWVFIYNAATLDQVDQLNVGAQVTSLAYNNGKLFLSTSDYNKGLAVYDRETKTEIFDTSYYGYGMQLRLLPGTNTELVAINSSYSSVKLKFNAAGRITTVQNQNLSTSYQMAPNLFEVFPSGDKFITGSYGTIFSSDLTYVSVLPHGMAYLNSFDFDETNNLVYCGTNQQEVHAYSLSNYLLQKKLKTTGYPIAVFYDNGTVICVSSGSYYGGTSTTLSFIERL